MSQIVMAEVDDATIPTPPAGSQAIFVDDVVGPARKDDTGTVTSLTGATGSTGPGYGGTSTTSLAIGTGSKAFTTQAGRAWLAGSRVRAASDADPDGDWMEGVVTAYVTTTLTVLMDRTLGSGTHTDWNLTIAGEPGQQAGTLHWAALRRNTNLSTPFNYYDSGAPEFTNNGVAEFDEVLEDTDGWFDIGEPTKFTTPAAIAALGLPLRFAANGIWTGDTTYAELKVFKNGDLENPIIVSQLTSNASNTAPSFCSMPIPGAVAGDYFELCPRTGDAATLLSADFYSLTWSVEVVGGAGPTGPTGPADDLDATLAASTGQDIADALSGAAAPDSGNVFATMADVAGGGGGLLAIHQYAAADNLWTRTTASLADVDATNAAITFTAPASGNVLIKASFLVGAPIANRVGQIGLRVAAANVAGPYQIAYSAGSAMYSMVEPTFYVTGLTPTTSYTYKLAFMGDGVAACQIFYGPVTGGSNPPFVMTVWEAP